MIDPEFPLCSAYITALREYLAQPDPRHLAPAHAFGAMALESSLLSTDLARFHERALVIEVLPATPIRKRSGVIHRAGVFFAAAISPMEESTPSSRSAMKQLKRFVEILSRRSVQLAASNLELNVEIAQRKAVEEALEQSKIHYADLLKESNRLQRQMRLLSRQIISAHEDERKKISRELHDVIAQTLTGINVRLATLKQDAALNTKGLAGNITKTQRLVEKSVQIVHRFARELRPAVLDDLGLIPALHSFLKSFTERTGVRAKLSGFPEIERTDSIRKTVLFRVAQEALINVSRHAAATLVEISFRKHDGHACMEVHDNGRSFHVPSVMHANRGRRLGLIGMRERVEMVGGTFSIESSPGNGTTVLVCVPVPKPGPRPPKKSGAGSTKKA